MLRGSSTPHNTPPPALVAAQRAADHQRLIHPHHVRQLAMNTIIVGLKPVLEALKAGTLLEKIVLLQGVRGTIIDEITAAAQRLKVPVGFMNRQEFRSLASDVTTQGIVALIARKPSASVEDFDARAAALGEPGFLLLLDEIEDPQNLGALVRTAECAGVHGVMLTRHHSAPINAAAVKASAGATEHMAIAEVTNLVSAIDDLKQRGFWIVALDQEGSRLYTDVVYAKPVALVVGNEGKGVRRLVRDHSDFVVQIPMYGKIASLNASVAGGLVMYEVARQRRALAPAPGEKDNGKSAEADGH